MGIWNSKSKQKWDEALWKYNALLTSAEMASLDARVTLMNASIIKSMPINDFYGYLVGEFYPWKYTAKNRLATTTQNLKNAYAKCGKYFLAYLNSIKDDLCNSILSDKDLIERALEIPGLGVAGATALLSIMYPDRFGTLDQFVVKELQNDPVYKIDPIIKKIDPNNIKLKEAVYLEELLQKKAKELNNIFGTYTWTPRAVDKCIWAVSTGRKRIIKHSSAAKTTNSTTKKLTVNSIKD